MQNEPQNVKPELLIKMLTRLINQPTLQLSAWVLAPLISYRTGLSEMAMREYRRTHVWAEGIHWQKNPKGRIVYNVQAIDQWMATAI